MNEPTLIDELIAFATARIRDILTSDLATDREKRTAREAERWHAAIQGETNDLGYSQDHILGLLLIEVRKWHDHPDYKDEWGDAVRR